MSRRLAFRVRLDPDVDLSPPPARHWALLMLIVALAGWVAGAVVYWLLHALATQALGLAA